MNRYKIEFTETLQKQIEIEADNELEAYKLAKDMYHNEDIVLDSSNFVGIDIDVNQLEKKPRIMELTSDEVQFLKEKYPEGTLIKLNKMDDPIRPVPPGTIGKVRCVDDAGTIHVSWENGQSLGLVSGVDSFVKLKNPSKKQEKSMER